MGSKLEASALQVFAKLSCTRIVPVLFLLMSHSLVVGSPPDKLNGLGDSQSKLSLEGSKSNPTNSTSSSVDDNPLNKVFPSNMYSKAPNSSNVTEHPDEILRKALINHTLAHGGKGDLDKLIFQSIPEGSKLVLQTVTVMRTDEDGNPIPGSETEEPVHWDVSLTNATDIEDEYEEDDLGDEAEESQESDSAKAERHTSDKDKDKSDTDLIIAGSHAQANYKTYGSGGREKEKKNKYYHGQDNGKTHKVTDTDTDGVKVKNYKGTEKGLTDFDHANGNSINKESERFRDTKRKNKGRRVSGFKRVYHKEEFQRTEHFFDDEEAKRIAESYGLKDSKEQSSHGTKGDDRKYHGVRKEVTDGKKIKNEHGTSKGYNKGQHTEYKDTEKRKTGSHYDRSQHSPNYNHGRHLQDQKQHHPNHNYHGSYSHPRNTIRQPNYPGMGKDTTMLISSDAIIGSLAQAPMVASFTVTPYEADSSTDSSTDGPIVVTPDTASNHHHPEDIIVTLTGPDEIRTFFSPRERERPRLVSSDYSETANHPFNYQPKPGHISDPSPRHHIYTVPKHRNPNIHSGYRSSPFHNKIGNATLLDDVHRKNYTNYYRNTNDTYDRERYARNYPTTVRNSLLGSSPGSDGYSTLIKVMPVTYINLTDSHLGRGNDIKDPQQSIKSNTVVSSPDIKHNSSNYKHSNTITFTTSVPQINRRPPGPPRSSWISISLGNPEGILEEGHRHPNHNYVGYSSIRPLFNSIVQGVKNKFMQPILRSPYPPQSPHVNGYRFDPSRYPPNVVQNNKINSFSNIPYSASTLTTNNKPNAHRNLQHRPLSRPAGVSPGYQTPYHNNGNVGNPYSFKGGHRPRSPHALPPFMNNLMDSVANFFSRMSKAES